MAKDPAFLFYPNDYLGGTMGMSFDLKGAYVELFILQFNRGGFSEEQAVNIIGSDRWNNLRGKFISVGPLFYNQRLKNEIEKRKKHSEHQRNNVNKRYQTSTKDDTKPLPLENEIENRDINTIFEWFWKIYDKKVGPKDRIKQKFSKLTRTDIEEIEKKLPEYVKSTPEKQYRKNPETWINQRGWEHEIISKGKGKNKNSEPDEF